MDIKIQIIVAAGVLLGLVCCYHMIAKKKSGTAVCACLAVCRRRDSCIGLFSADPDIACPMKPGLQVRSICCFSLDFASLW